MKVAKIKSEVLFDKIMKLSPADARNDFIFRRLENEILAIRDIDPSDCYSMLGLLHTKKADKENTVSNHQRASVLAPNDPIIWNNYAASMFHFFHFNEAEKYAIKAHELAQHEIRYLINLLYAKEMLFRFHEAEEEILFKMSKLSPENIPQDANIIKPIVRIMDSNGITDADYSRIAGIMTDLMKLEEIYLYRETLSIKRDTWIRRTLYLDIEMEKAIELEYELYKRISSEIPRHVARTVELRFLTEDMPNFEFTDEDIKNEIEKYEKQFGMSSEEFLALRKIGQDPDTFETNAWSALLNIRL